MKRWYSSIHGTSLRPTEQNKEGNRETVRFVRLKARYHGKPKGAIPFSFSGFLLCCWTQKMRREAEGQSREVPQRSSSLGSIGMLAELWVWFAMEFILVATHGDFSFIFALFFFSRELARRGLEKFSGNCWRRCRDITAPNGRRLGLRKFHVGRLDQRHIGRALLHPAYLFDQWYSFDKLVPSNSFPTSSNKLIFKCHSSTHFVLAKSWN